MGISPSDSMNAWETSGWVSAMPSMMTAANSSGTAWPSSVNSAMTASASVPTTWVAAERAALICWAATSGSTIKPSATRCWYSSTASADCCRAVVVVSAKRGTPSRAVDKISTPFAASIAGSPTLEPMFDQNSVHPRFAWYCDSMNPNASPNSESSSRLPVTASSMSASWSVRPNSSLKLSEASTAARPNPTSSVTAVWISVVNARTSSASMLATKSSTAGRTSAMITLTTSVWNVRPSSVSRTMRLSLISAPASAMAVADTSNGSAKSTSRNSAATSSPAAPNSSTENRARAAGSSMPCMTVMTSSNAPGSPC